MTKPDPKKSQNSQADTNKKKPLRVLSTSLGIVLAANMALAPQAFGETAAKSSSDSSKQPVLVEWSTPQVKAYFDPQVDWNIPYPGQKGAAGSATPTPSPSPSGQSGPTTVVVNNGFGWQDILLYHMLFNSGRVYSTTQWYGAHPVFNPRTNQPFKARTFKSGTFQNKPTAGSVIRPKASKSTGSFTTRKSTSSTRGSIGGRSSGFSSSGRSAGSSFGRSSGGFFGG